MVTIRSLSFLNPKNQVRPKCKGIRVVKNHGRYSHKRICSNPASNECPACETPLCGKCSYDASRHRKACYGGKDIK